MESRHMSDRMQDDLRKLVTELCDSLYNQRQLITKNVVINQILGQSDWLISDLEHLVPQYINSWRLANIETADSVHQERTVELEAQIYKYQASLQHAEVVISKLRAELVAQKQMAKQQRTRIIQGLRDMFGNN